MKQNLDTLRTEIETHLRDSGFLVFHGLSRSIAEKPEIDWDTAHYPDYKAFAGIAKDLGVRLIVMHHRQFDSDIVDRALEEVQESGYEYGDQRQIETRLRELAMYDGFTCVVELSFDHEGVMYVFELRTEWYEELSDILDQLDMTPDDEDDDDDETFGGYYSKN